MSKKKAVEKELNVLPMNYAITTPRKKKGLRDWVWVTLSCLSMVVIALELIYL